MVEAGLGLLMGGMVVAACCIIAGMIGMYIDERDAARNRPLCAQLQGDAVRMAVRYGASWVWRDGRV